YRAVWPRPARRARSQSAQSEEGQDEHDHDHKAYQIDQSVHGNSQDEEWFRRRGNAGHRRWFHPLFILLSRIAAWMRSTRGGEALYEDEQAAEAARKIRGLCLSPVRLDRRTEATR